MYHTLNFFCYFRPPLTPVQKFATLMDTVDSGNSCCMDPPWTRLRTSICLPVCPADCWRLPIIPMTTNAINMSSSRLFRTVPSSVRWRSLAPVLPGDRGRPADVDHMPSSRSPFSIRAADRAREADSSYNNGNNIYT